MAGGTEDWGMRVDGNVSLQSRVWCGSYRMSGPVLGEGEGDNNLMQIFGGTFRDSRVFEKGLT